MWVEGPYSSFGHRRGASTDVYWVCMAGVLHTSRKSDPQRYISCTSNN